MKYPCGNITQPGRDKQCTSGWTGIMKRSLKTYSSTASILPNNIVAFVNPLTLRDHSNS